MTVTHTLFDDSQMSFTITLGFWINHRLLWTLKLPMSAVLAGMQSIQFCARSQKEAAEAETVTYLFVFFSQWLMSRGAACAADRILLTEAAFIKERPVFETEMRILYSPPPTFPFSISLLDFHPHMSCDRQNIPWGGSHSRERKGIESIQNGPNRCSNLFCGCS